MPFTRNRKKNMGDNAPERTVTPATKDYRTLSEDGLFDIAFSNYKSLNPESGMKRRDFRRNIWGSDDVMDYLSEEQAMLYQSYLSGALAEVTRVQREEGQLVPQSAQPDEYASDSYAAPALDDAEVLEGILTESMVNSSETGREIQSDRVDAAAGLDDVSGVAQVEPAYDMHFLDGFLDDPEDAMTERSDHADDIEDPTSKESVLTDEPERGCAQFYETEQDENTCVSEDPVEHVSNPMTQQQDEIWDEAVGDVTQSKTLSYPKRRQVDEGSSVMSGTEPTARILQIPDSEQDDVGEVADVIRNSQTAELVEHSSSECEQENDRSGIFAVEGVMERLRRSMYLDASDTSMDDEIMQLEPREIFEQLIRLEGCARKVGAICDIAELTFGTGNNERTTDGLSNERLREILATAAEAIGSLMRLSCDTEQWNATIAEYMGLTEEERRMHLLPQLDVNEQFVVRVKETKDELSGTYYVVTGDFTELCHVLFRYEDAYDNIRMQDIEYFFTLYGLQFCEYDGISDDYVEDIIVEKGKVRIN